MQSRKYWTKFRFIGTLRPFSTCKLILTKRSVFYCFVNTQAELINGDNGIHYFRYDTVEVEKRPLDKNPFLEDQRNFIIQDPINYDLTSLRPVSNVEFCMHRMQFKQCIMRKPI